MPRVYAPPVQCQAVTRAFRRCSITSASDFRDGQGRLVAEPLRRGGPTCLLHMNLFSSVAAPPSPAGFMIFFIDLETSGLDVLNDEVLELALTEDASGAQFASTVRPLRLPEGLGVHGIGQEELLTSMPFSFVFERMMDFLRGISERALVDDQASDDSFDDCLPLPALQLPPPNILLCAHNALKFDLPMLVSECLRHDCNVFELADFYYCDTLQVVRAHGAQIADGCARLQCMARCCSCGGGDRAHRALEDTVALRNVMRHFAAASGLSTKSLLTPFARRFDVHATLLARSFLC